MLSPFDVQAAKLDEAWQVGLVIRQFYAEEAPLHFCAILPFVGWNSPEDLLGDNRPLAKLNRTIEIANTGNEGKAESKTLSAVAVTFRKDTECECRLDISLGLDGMFHKIRSVWSKKICLMFRRLEKTSCSDNGWIGGF